MINVALIGAGIGREHLAGYRLLPDRFRVATLCDLDLKRATEVAGQDGGIALTDNLDAVLADPAIDIVDICLPPHLHFPVTRQVLRAGKHVICEKPYVRSLAEADQIDAAVQASGKTVFPVFQYRYGPGMAQLRALQKAGLAGRAFVGSVETHWRRDADYYDNPWRGTWAGESGGALLGHAIHSHDLICCILGPVAELSVMTGTLVNAIEVEDCAALAFRMESGALVTSSVTLGAGDNTSRLRFCFEGFTVESQRNPYRPAIERWTFTARSASQDQIDAITQGVPDVLGGFAGYLDAVADALDGRPGEEVTLRDGRRSIELVTAAYASARHGASMALPLRPDSELYAGWLPDLPGE